MNDPVATDICRQMDIVRSHLGDEVEEIVDSTRTLTDWRFYVGKYPWLCLAGAAAVGFWAVPKTVEMIRPSADVIEELARRHKLVVKQDGKAQARSGMGGALLSVLANAAARSAINYFAHLPARNANAAAPRGTEHGESHCG